MTATPADRRSAVPAPSRPPGDRPPRIAGIPGCPRTASRCRPICAAGRSWPGSTTRSPVVGRCGPRCSCPGRPAVRCCWCTSGAGRCRWSRATCPIPEEIGVNDEAEDAVEAELVRALSASGDLNGVTWELVSTTGEAGAELVRIADERDAACVVVGKRHTGFSDFLHRIASGSVSRAVVARQKFPVLVVP